jgi:hypothetical protein
MRKLLLSLLLPFALLLSQQGAVLHEISHLADAAARGDGPRAHPPGDLQCEACLAFAHLAGVATLHVPAPALLSLDFQLAAVDTPVFIGADAPSARSRGPPAVL